MLEKTLFYRCFLFALPGRWGPTPELRYPSSSMKFNKYSLVSTYAQSLRVVLQGLRD